MKLSTLRCFFPFSGVGIKAFNKAGTDITSDLFAANGFMLVDGYW